MSPGGGQRPSEGAGAPSYSLADGSNTARVCTPQAYGYEAIDAADTGCASESNG
ncbi:hypothetical protein ACFOQM_09765 [Paenibacillus sp. GCM10012307]|uniref:Uncharacterized protein n=1 Tax=Paenibacillus roseus TaxID=2798579 RepID=A0A934MKY1_9BACL|nr:hypothetical protein [Paenibacillus roseus]MBJ6361570.1 hypothetical protein [Paenibacillus roseus]